MLEKENVLPDRAPTSYPRMSSLEELSVSASAFLLWKVTTTAGAIVTMAPAVPLAPGDVTCSTWCRVGGGRHQAYEKGPAGAIP